MSFIGIGTSLGQPLDVPVLVRSLAASIGCLDEDYLSLHFDHDFLLTLDSDISEQNKMCRKVKVYASAWWNERKPRSLDWADIFNKLSLNACLQTHLEQITGNIVTSTALPVNPLPVYPPAYPPATHSSLEKNCNKCEEYSHVLSNTLIDLVDIHNYAKALSTSSETQWNMDMRRASTLYLLHQASVIKDVAGSSSDPVVVRPRVDSVRETAVSELVRLQNLPPMSHKWTWGEALTESDVLAIHRSIPSREKQFHSGYGFSLQGGKAGREGSPFPSMPASWGIFDDIAGEGSAIPDNVVPQIVPLEKIRTLLYDPLGKDEIPLSIPAGPRKMADLTKNNLFLHTLDAGSVHETSEGVEKLGPSEFNQIEIENVWPSGSDSNVEETEETPAVDIEDTWSSDSEGSKPPGVSIEDIWDSASEDLAEEKVVGKGPAIPVEDHLESENSDADVSTGGIEEEWSSATEDDQSSSIADSNARLIVSHSEITIENPTTFLSSFPFSDAWPDLVPLSQDSIVPNSTLETPAPAPLESFRNFHPEDFNTLQDHMFEDLLSGESDSEFAEEDDEE